MNCCVDAVEVFKVLEDAVVFVSNRLTQLTLWNSHSEQRAGQMLANLSLPSSSVPLKNASPH